MTTMNVGGIVLCGGRSQRMGSPKAWLPFAGERMLPRMTRLIAEVVQPVIVVAAPDQHLPPLPAAATVLRDEEKGRGPLQGMAAGLAALDGKADAAYLSGCDAPLLRPAFVHRLIELLGNHAICVPHVGGCYHPLAAVYRLSVLPEVRRLLSEDRLRPIFLLETMTTRVAMAPDLEDVDPRFLSLRNLNTREDYEAALREAHVVG